MWAGAVGPAFGMPERGGRRGVGSLIPAGPSLSFLGHLLVLQHHVGDEHSWNIQIKTAG